VSGGRWAVPHRPANGVLLLWQSGRPVDCRPGGPEERGMEEQ
jgi:hypothetical protein